MTEQKNEELKQEVDLGHCTRHAAYPVDQGMHEIEQDLGGVFGKTKKKVRIVTQEFARCIGELCETSWCKIHEACKDVCEHHENFHKEEEILDVLEDVLIRRGVGDGDVADIVNEVRTGLSEGTNDNNSDYNIPDDVIPSNIPEMTEDNAK